MKLIVGLGNIGKNYDLSYHNMGFLAIDELVKKLALDPQGQKKFESSFWQSQLEGKNFVLLKPHTFMNLSGKALVAATNFFKIALDDLLVVHDDLDLPFGKLRYRKKGSHGGHNGLRNIIYSVGSSDFQRLKIGIGRSETFASRDYVLSQISSHHKQMLPTIFEQSCNLLTDFILGKNLQVT